MPHCNLQVRGRWNAAGGGWREWGKAHCTRLERPRCCFCSAEATSPESSSHNSIRRSISFFATLVASDTRAPHLVTSNLQGAGLAQAARAKPQSGGRAGRDPNDTDHQTPSPARRLPESLAHALDGADVTVPLPTVDPRAVAAVPATHDTISSLLASVA